MAHYSMHSQFLACTVLQYHPGQVSIHHKPLARCQTARLAARVSQLEAACCEVPEPLQASPIKRCPRCSQAIHHSTFLIFPTPAVPEPCPTAHNTDAVDALNTWGVFLTHITTVDRPTSTSLKPPKHIQRMTVRLRTCFAAPCAGHLA